MQPSSHLSKALVASLAAHDAWQRVSRALAMHTQHSVQQRFCGYNLPGYAAFIDFTQNACTYFAIAALLDCFNLLLISFLY